jgi:hypothetical protein
MGLVLVVRFRVWMLINLEYCGWRALGGLFKALLQQGAVESPQGRVHGVAMNELPNAALEKLSNDGVFTNTNTSCF